MLHKSLIRWIGLSLICIVVSACITTTNRTDNLSKEQKADLYLQLGVRYLEMGELKTAKEKLYKALAVGSKNAEIQNALAALHERLKQDEIAREFYQQAMVLEPDNVSILNNYGRFLCDKDDYEQGKQVLQQVLALPLNNRKWFAYTHIGRCELKQGFVELAESNFRQALQANRNFPPALYEMQQISFNSGKFMSSRAFLERYLQFANHTAETLWVAVQTEQALGNKKEAEKYAERLLVKFPASKEAQQLRSVRQN